MFSLSILLLPLLACQVGAQGTCESDTDCNEAQPCCSGFGFCGSGEGFCTPSTRVGPAGKPPGKSGAGCSLEDTDIVGGDLPVTLGGGGVKLDRDSADQCFNRCDENPFCQWFTYDGETKLCYLKDRRGYLVNRNRTEGERFTSGATFRDGCNPDPCLPPYSYHSYQCLYFPQGPATLQGARESCRDHGGFLPFSYSGYSGGRELGERWHWLDHQDSRECYACRPARWSEGIRRVSCQEQLSFACERDRLYSYPTPKLPDIIDFSQPKDNSLRPLSRIRPGNIIKPRRRFYRRRRRPFSNRFNFIRNPYFAF